MKKKTLYFDASFIIDNYKTVSRNRTGIYFASYNLLKKFAEDKRFSIFMDFYPQDYEIAMEFIKNEKLDNVKLAKNYNLCKLIEKIVVERKKARENKKRILQFLLSIKKRILLSYYHLKQVFYYDIAFTPFLPFDKTVKSKVSSILLYDAIPLIFPEYFPERFWFHDLCKKIKYFDHCFTISESTKKDFVKYIPSVNENQYTVSHLGVSDNFYHEKKKEKIREIKNKYNIPLSKKYIFSLCTLEPRKNLIKEVKSFISFIKKYNIDNLVFVLGGTQWDEFIKKLDKEVEGTEKYAKYIIKAGYIDDNDLPILYSGAEWFVYTSQYEGFGLPPLEAMKCACPVITSNNSSLPEVINDAGIMIDCESEQAHIKAFECFYFKPKFRKKMAFDGYKRAQFFTWERTSNIILDKLYDLSLKQRFYYITKIIKKLDNFLCNIRLMNTYVIKLLNGNKSKKVALFSILPPQKSGIAEYSYKTFTSDTKLYDIFSDINGKELETYAKSSNIFPLLLKRVFSYKARVFVLGNSEHHVKILKHAIKTNGEGGRILYLHESYLIDLFYWYYRQNTVLLKSKLIKNYAQHQKLIEKSKDLYADFITHKIYGIKLLIKLTGITNFIVNNDRAKEMIFEELSPELKKLVCVNVGFLPVVNLINVKKENIDSSVDFVIGSFGKPQKQKSTDIIINATKILCERGIKIKLLLAGYGVNSYLKDKKYNFIIPIDSPNEDDLYSLMKSVDLAIQLRPHPHGESSGCISQLFGMSQNIITTKGFVSKEFEKYCCIIDSEQTPESLANHILNRLHTKVNYLGQELSNTYSFCALAQKIYDIASDAKPSSTTLFNNYLKPGDVVYFNNPIYLDDFAGFSEAESSGCWTASEKAKFSMNITSDKDVSVYFETIPFLHQKHKELKMSIYVNNRLRKIVQYNLNKKNNNFMLKIKEKECQDTVQLKFKINYPMSPKELQLSNDARKLGVHFISLKLAKE